ncbi:RNA polymerase sigma factor [Mucilaginibacter sp. KACC 22063]|uniref:RNA polymerase sigma factor n=1 Tax=Mucilaginibacter sp. KACC 22063 TaxID=3025666 RepID=UPI0023672B77|nr:sigma-70 family RNA polymerase sigma factor [Mucilaginibacter sp. KACC 22063]WDF56220.1 sigma-70 family RNA polymerase sigma factor [Mucilaginibacter sp. KACC 22063]
MENEKELISRIINQDVKAFKILVIQHEKLVVFIISRIIQNNEDVKDLSQEVFIKVYSNISQFKFESKLSTWIARIAYFTAINYVKKVSGKRGLTDDISNFENLHQTEENPETLLLKKNQSNFIQQEINKLPVNYRTVLTLYHLNEFSYQEIYEITGMPEGTVKNYLFRARKQIKDQLETYLNKL